MPSVWNFVGVEARTAPTALVFQVRTASGGGPGCGCDFAGATARIAAAAAAMNAMTMPAATSTVLLWRLFFMTPPFRVDLSCREESRAAMPRRARAPCHVPPGHDAGFPRRAFPRPPRGPRTRIRNEARCPRLLATNVETAA